MLIRLRATMLVAASFLIVLAAALPAQADTLICDYRARLSGKDHFNSRGVRLDSAAAIIRQDRFYVHELGQGDPEDEGDCFFGSKRNREILEQLINRGRTTAQARNAIINGTPMIHVQIYRSGGGADYVNVTVY